MRLVLFLRYLVPLFLIMSGCDPSWRNQMPNGTKFYQQADHKYFGKVIAYEARHDFHNGTPPGPAVLIETTVPGQAPQWGSCVTCAASFRIEAP